MEIFIMGMIIGSVLTIICKNTKQNNKKETKKQKYLDHINSYKLMEAPYMAKLLEEKRYGEFTELLKQSEVEIAYTVCQIIHYINGD